MLPNTGEDSKERLLGVGLILFLGSSFFFLKQKKRYRKFFFFLFLLAMIASVSPMRTQAIKVDLNLWNTKKQISQLMTRAQFKAAVLAEVGYIKYIKGYDFTSYLLHHSIVHSSKKPKDLHYEERSYISEKVFTKKFSKEMNDFITKHRKKGKVSGTINSLSKNAKNKTYTFLTGDLHFALNEVTPLISYNTRKKNDYRKWVTIYDVYDFKKIEWRSTRGKNNEKFSTKLANNFTYSM